MDWPFSASAWLSNEKLGSVGPAARGIWMEIDALMEHHEVWQIKGTESELATALRLGGNQLQFGLKDLKKAGILSVVKSGKQIKISNFSRRDRSRTLEQSTVRFRMVEMPDGGKKDSTKVSQKPNLFDPNESPVRSVAQPEKASQPTRGITEMQVILNEWNMIPGIVKCQRLTPKRQRALSARLNDEFWRDNWRQAIDKLQSPEADWIRGQNERGWTANFDWFIRPDTLEKIIEGQYDSRTKETDIDRMLKGELF